MPAGLHIRRTAAVLILSLFGFFAGAIDAGAQTFSNPNPIAIPASGSGASTGAPASPYPSNIAVAGLTAPISKVAVTLYGFSHTFPDDVDILLVAPDGSKLVLLSDAGDTNDLNGATITLSDDAVAAPADSAAIPTGAYRPANYSIIVDPFPAPAPVFSSADSPAPGGTATFATQFAGHSGNGTWSLYVVDDAGTDIGAIAGGWSITFYQLTAPAAGQLIISELRYAGLSGPQDEFVEIYNASATTHVVNATSGTGYGIAASDGVTRCTIPNGTVIPSGGHFLCVDLGTYSLLGYGQGDATFTTDIPNNAGVAIFNNNTGGGSYSLANRLDAVGATSEANTTYKEGAGLLPLTAFSIDQSWVRKTLGGCTGSQSTGNCINVGLISGTPGTTATVVDTNDNANDFIYVDANGTSAGAGQRLGAPGPQSLASPIHQGDGSAIAPLDVCTSNFTVPNRVRDTTPGTNASQGTLDIRRRFYNSSGVNVTRLRFRILDLTTFPSISGVSDLRPFTSSTISATVNAPPCSVGASTATVQGTTLDQPPSQPNGGGYNSTLSVASISPGTPLASGSGVNVRFLLGIQQVGLARFCVMTETWPATPSSTFCYIGSTEVSSAIQRPSSSDFNDDAGADIALYRPGTGQWYLGSLGTVISWGLPGDIPVPGDYNGDGISDVAVYRPATGQWLIRNIGTFVLGSAADIPVPGDYNGDGITDVAVYRRQTGQWFIRNIGTFTYGGPQYLPVPADYDGDGTDDLAVYAPATGTWYVQDLFTIQWGLPGDQPVPGDYDADGFADIAVYRPATGTWFIRNLSTVQWGILGDVPIPGDYDADGQFDIAVYRPSTGQWLIRNLVTLTYGLAGDTPFPSHPQVRHPSSRDMDGDRRDDFVVFRPSNSTWYTRLSSTGTTSTIPWGLSGDVPVAGDYDGDGYTDPTVFRPSNGTWYALQSLTGYSTVIQVQWGLPGDIPLTADFDADGISDMVVFRPSTGFWYVKLSSTGFTTSMSRQWGLNGDVPKPGDYDGDGLADFAVYRPSSNLWFVLLSSTGFTTSLTKSWGLSGDVPVAADFDGDGRIDMAVYRPSSGGWFILRSLNNFTTSQSATWGVSGDISRPGDFDGDGKADLVVYRPSTGQWFVALSSTNFTTNLVISWGLSGDSPQDVSGGSDR
jgi:subtilisin-like proprotein convertase family protein